MSSKNNHIKQFWNDECDIISSHLLSHIQIDSADDIYNDDKSWFLQNHKFSFNDFEETNLYKENISIKHIIRNRKIRIYPTQKQKILFKKWIGVSRKFYNETLSIYKNGSDKNWNKIYQDIAEKFKDLDYIKSIPYQIKKIAVRDYNIALFTNKRTYKGLVSLLI